MPDGEEPVAEPTLESLNAYMRAQSSLLRELATAVAQLTARDRVVDGEGAHGSGSGQRFAGQPTGSGGAAERPDLLELAQSGRVGAKSVSAEDDYLAVPELLQRAQSGYEAVRPVSRVPGLFPLSTDLTNEYLKQDDRRLPAQEEYLWMSCFGAHMAALFVALDELLPYVPATNQNFTPYLARARNHAAEAIDKAFRFRLAFLRRLNEIKRVHEAKQFGISVATLKTMYTRTNPRYPNYDGTMFQDMSADEDEDVVSSESEWEYEGGNEEDDLELSPTTGRNLTAPERLVKHGTVATIPAGTLCRSCKQNALSRSIPQDIEAEKTLVRYKVFKGLVGAKGGISGKYTEWPVTGVGVLEAHAYREGMKEYEPSSASSTLRGLVIGTCEDLERSGQWDWPRDLQTDIKKRPRMPPPEYAKPRTTIEAKLEAGLQRCWKKQYDAGVPEAGARAGFTGSNSNSHSCFQISDAVCVFKSSEALTVG
eukprot:jgi/Tetstr1/426977/TSEL_017190.t1